MTRKNNRSNDEMRPLEIEVGVNKHAEGSALIKFGDTHVICTASIENHVPRWMRGSNEGWITAEYGMLPRSTHERMNREAARGCLLYTSPSPRDRSLSRMPSSA